MPRLIDGLQEVAVDYWPTTPATVSGNLHATRQQNRSIVSLSFVEDLEMLLQVHLLGSVADIT